MTTSKPRVAIRQAVPSDKLSVFEISSQAWSGDYIPEVWDDWVSGRNGKVLVATIDERVVGVAHAYLQTSGHAWLEGVRVHRNFRGQGIAGKLNKALIEYARENGAKIARLCTGADNKASQKHLTKTGFRLSQKYSRYSSKRPLKGRLATIGKVREYNRRLWSCLRASPEYEHYKGLFADGWTWYVLSWQALRKLVREGKVLQTKGMRDDSRGTNVGLSIVLRDERGLTVGYISGNVEQVEELARYSRTLLKKSKWRETGRVRIIVPRDSILQYAIRRAGYVRTGETWVYTKRIAP